MEEKLKGTNFAFVSGIVISDFQDRRTDYEKKQYVSNIEVRRLSGKTDKIPVIVPVRLAKVAGDYKGQYVCASGQYRSRNCYDGQKHRLELYIYVRNLSAKTDENVQKDSNYVFLDGYLCKEPIYRMTPLGRTITDLMVAVNRPYGRSDYIPCVCWENTARLAASLTVGSHVEIIGRVQSREYVKQLSGREPETRVAYEVAVSKLNVRES